MKSSCRLHLEVLEEREVPSASIFGNAWLDGAHLTLSFAPDGTDIAGVSSQLTQILSGSDAKRELLRAFQTWAVQSNINIGIVADGGQSFTTGGEIQGDSRFGDIRIGARPLGSDALAITSPFNYFNSYSGNVVLNSAQSLGTTYDLYTAMLQEAGHALGLSNSSDPSSVMYENYIGLRTGLSEGDIANVRAMYGSRPADAFEGAGGNDTLATATRYSNPVSADISSSGDQDWFRFSTPLLFPGTTIHLRAAGQSLLTARLSVFDANGGLVASTSASDQLNNDLTLKLTGLRSLSRYYVRVEGASDDVFGIGSYKLSITNTLTDTVANTVGGAVQLLDNELGLNDTIATATALLPQSASVNLQVDFLVRASISANVDIDSYRVTAPSAPAGTPVVLVATAWELGSSNLNPLVEVYDAGGNRIAAEVLTNDSSTYTVQVRNAVAGQEYFLKVRSESGATGNYALATDFRTSTIDFPMGADSTLNGSAPTASGMLAMQHSGMMHFVLAADSSNPGTTVTMTIRNGAGDVVAMLQSKAGDAQSLDVLLLAGYYTVQISAASGDGSPLSNVRFHLAAIGTSDPVGAQPVDPSQNPEGSPPPPILDPNSPPPPASSDWCYWWGLTPTDQSIWY